MSLASEQDADLTEMLVDAGQTFTWSGSDYACIGSDEADMSELKEGGFGLDYDVFIVTRAALFSTVPTAQPKASQTVTYKGSTLRILKTALNQSGKILTLFLGTTHR